MKFFKSIENSRILFIILVFIICRLSFGKAIESNFWKDDWAWLWSANFNPRDFYHTTVGRLWPVRTGLFMPIYVLELHKFIQDSYHWQIIGFLLKFLSSLIFACFIQSLTKKKYLAIIGALLFASYSGGIESYTWHKLNAVAVTFVLISVTMYAKFLDTYKRSHYFLFFLAATLSYLSYLGRAAGLIPFIILWNILEYIRIKEKKKRKSLVISSFLLFLPFVLVVAFVKSIQPLSDNYLISSIKQHKLFFGNIGNLLKNPFVKVYELGYHTEIDLLGIILGYGLILVGIVFFVKYLITKSRYYQLISLFIFWIYFFYLPNWPYGGGGITILLGSGHRYLSTAGIGVVTLWLVIMQRFKKSHAIVISTVLVLINIDYSKHLISLESSVRNRHLTQPIYQELYEKMKDDEDIQLVVIDTPNELKSFVVGGWYPYTLAYYKGLTEVTQFPVVIPFWDHAVQWVCSDPSMKKEIQVVGGFGDNRSLDYLDIEHIYAWSLEVNGHLTDKTNIMRNITQKCQDERRVAEQEKE